MPQKGNILLSALKLFFPLCLLQFFFHFDPGDSKKVIVNQSLPKHKEQNETEELLVSVEFWNISNASQFHIQ